VKNPLSDTVNSLQQVSIRSGNKLRPLSVCILEWDFSLKP
jgi:hypothetical protein